MTQALTTEWSPCRPRLRAGAYSNAKLHLWRKKGQAPDVSVGRGGFWRLIQRESMSAVCGYGEER
jgi:hypothetical protein